MRERHHHGLGRALKDQGTKAMIMTTTMVMMMMMVTTSSFLFAGLSKQEELRSWLQHPPAAGQQEIRHGEIRLPAEEERRVSQSTGLHHNRRQFRCTNPHHTLLIHHLQLVSCGSEATTNICRFSASLSSSPVTFHTFSAAIHTRQRVN